MKPLPLKVPDGHGMAVGDVVTIEGQYNRPRVKSWAWWAMLILGAEFACRHINWAFRRKATDEFYHVTGGRRWLLGKRQLQTYVISETATSGSAHG